MTPDQIAVKLTAAQRGVMLGKVRYPKWATQQKLIDFGLIHVVKGMIEYTPLGLAVRQIILIEQEQGK